MINPRLNPFFLLCGALLFTHSCKARKFNGEMKNTAESRFPASPVYSPANRKGWGGSDHYLDRVQPVLAARCVACHSCTAAPCQLNLTSFETLSRGASQSKPYGGHVKAMPEGPTRYADALSIEAWRKKGFYSVLEPDPKSSLFSQALKGTALKDESDWQAARAHLSSEAFVCPTDPGNWTRTLSKTKVARMPAGMPQLSAHEASILESWMDKGARGPDAEAARILAQPEGGSPRAAQVIQSWEAFLNQDAPREQLVGRYVYEHAFLARWHFREVPGEFYEIVRSETPPGTPIKQIVTDWIQDAPKVRPYYRLRRISRIIDARQHALWDLDGAALARLKQLFFGSPWTLATLPGYESINPFVTFQAIPVKARSAFMRENSRMLYQSYAKGPICVGPLATYAVDEHFWIWFLNDDADPSVLNPTLGLKDYTSFYDRRRGSAEAGGSDGSFIWNDHDYYNAFVREFRKLRPGGLSLDDVWKGDSANPNAWLTVFRSEISTNVHTGVEASMGGLPVSAWLMSYANFERMYYNGAAQFAYWGSAKHKIESFNHQIMTRTEAEDLFLTLLKASERNRLRAAWNGSFPERFSKTSWGEIFNPRRWLRAELHEMPDSAQMRPTLADLATEQWKRTGEKVRGPEDSLNGWPRAQAAQASEGGAESRDTIESLFSSLTRRSAKEVAFPRFLPNQSFVRIGRNAVYTLLTNRGYRRDKLALMEKASRRPEEDELVVIRGLVGATPEIFFDVPEGQTAAFVKDLKGLKSPEDWSALRMRWGLKREDPAFWTHYDWFVNFAFAQNPKEAGVLDLNYYDLRI